MKVEFHPSTVDDVGDAENHYKKLQPGLHLVFRAEVISTIERICESPFLYAEVSGVRRALLRRFPFSVVYRVDAETIRILLIRHHKRRPFFGQQRR